MIELNEKNFEEEIKKYPRLLVMFYREAGCSHCDKAKPLFEEYAKEAGHECAMYKLGKTPDSVNAKYPIERFPTFYAFENGVAINSVEGHSQPFNEMFTKKPKLLKIAEAPLSVLVNDQMNLIDQLSVIKGQLNEVTKEIDRRKNLAYSPYAISAGIGQV